MGLPTTKIGMPAKFGLPRLYGASRHHGDYSADAYIEVQEKAREAQEPHRRSKSAPPTVRTAAPAAEADAEPAAGTKKGHRGLLAGVKQVGHTVSRTAAKTARVAHDEITHGSIRLQEKTALAGFAGMEKALNKATHASMAASMPASATSVASAIEPALRAGGRCRGAQGAESRSVAAARSADRVR